MRVWLVVLVLVALLLIGLGLGYAYLDLKSVDGVVRDAKGQPIGGASLTLAGRSTFSDKAGNFHLAISRGTWTLIGVARGYASAEQTVTADDLFQKNYQAALTLPADEISATTSAASTTTADAPAVTGAAPAVTATISATETPRPPPTATAPSETNAPAQTRVTVVDAYSQVPLANVAVTAGDQTATSDGQGNLVLLGLTDGTTITAQTNNYAVGRADYQGEAALTLALRPTTLDGIVRDAVTKKPVPQALILYSGKIIEADARGAFHLDNVPEELQLAVKEPGYLYATFAIQRASHFDLNLTPFEARGIHFYYGMSRPLALALLNEIHGTEINTIVWDVKEGPGEITWDSQIPLAQQLKAYRQRDLTAPDMVQLCHERNLYCIARMTVFKDTHLAVGRPDLALHSGGGAIFSDGAAAWVNPAKKEVWDYAIGLAKELSGLGFDEIQFDYIRYPGRPTPLEFGSPATRVDTIKSFLAAASAALKPLPVFFSGDLFGLTTAANVESGIGQLMEEDAPNFDYVSPMMYPSTWGPNSALVRIGLNVPACINPYACPYEIIHNGTMNAYKRGKTLVRPWLQAYAGPGFGVQQYILQKKGADDANSAGWLFWNNQGLYPVEMFGKK